MCMLNKYVLFVSYFVWDLVNSNHAKFGVALYGKLFKLSTCKFLNSLYYFITNITNTFYEWVTQKLHKSNRKAPKKMQFIMSKKQEEFPKRCIEYWAYTFQEA